MASPVRTHPGWLGIVVVAGAGLFSACSSDSVCVAHGSHDNTAPGDVHDRHDRRSRGFAVRSHDHRAEQHGAASAGGHGDHDDHDARVNNTQDCRSDSTCPSSEHRTGDACGGELIVDVDGYLEGRHDAEAGRPNHVDNAPAPTADDDDDDDATVGPQTRYRAGYVQGWCDGTS